MWVRQGSGEYPETDNIRSGKDGSKPQKGSKLPELGQSAFGRDGAKGIRPNTRCKEHAHDSGT